MAGVEVLRKLDFRVPITVPEFSELPTAEGPAIAGFEGKVYIARDLGDGNGFGWIDIMTVEVEDLQAVLGPAVTAEFANQLPALQASITSQIDAALDTRLPAELDARLANFTQLINDQIASSLNAAIQSALDNATSIGGILIEDIMLKDGNTVYEGGEIGVTPSAGPGEEVEPDTIDFGSDA